MSGYFVSLMLWGDEPTTLDREWNRLAKLWVQLAPVVSQSSLWLSLTFGICSSCGIKGCDVSLGQPRGSDDQARVAKRSKGRGGVQCTAGIRCAGDSVHRLDVSLSRDD